MPSDFPSFARWQAALLSTFLISSFPNIFLFLVPASWLSSKSDSWFNIQHVLLAFASGGLLGDVLLHAIPHLMAAAHGPDDEGGSGAQASGEDAVGDFMASVQQEVAAQLEEEGAGGCSAHDTRSLVIGSLVLAGFLFFFTCERLLTIFLQRPPHSHSHAHPPPLSHEEAEEEEDGDYSTLTVRDLKRICRDRELSVEGKKADLVQRCQASSSLRKDEASSSNSSTGPAFYEVLTASGWLNICADFMHNFTDGLAMGASHASGDGQLALAATLSIFFHEVPHEIGDFAILIESGLSKHSAIRMQFCTSAGAFLGTAVGLLTSSRRGWDGPLIALTSGGFLYVATVSLIPTILDKHKHQEARQQHGQGRDKGQVVQILLETAAFAAGVGMMAAVSVLEAGSGHHH